eukprot:scaffold1052_cov339-Pavlova_lutheri.AAC.8
MGVSQLSSQVSSQCAETWDCRKMVVFSGSNPLAKYSAAEALLDSRSSMGSCGAVMACKSTTQKWIVPVGCTPDSTRFRRASDGACVDRSATSVWDAWDLPPRPTRANDLARRAWRAENAPIARANAPVRRNLIRTDRSCPIQRDSRDRLKGSSSIGCSRDERRDDVGVKVHPWPPC